MKVHTYYKFDPKQNKVIVKRMTISEARSLSVALSFSRNPQEAIQHAAEMHQISAIKTLPNEKIVFIP